MMTLFPVIQAALSSGESVVWSGQPRQGLFWRTSDMVIVFSLLCMAASILLSAVMTLNLEHYRSGVTSLWLILWSVVFAPIVSCFIIGRIFVDAKYRKSAFYALTTQRIIIISGISSRKVQSLPLKALSQLTLIEHADGSGTITFGEHLPWGALSGSEPAFGLYRGARFEQIPKAREVDELIRQTQMGV